MTIIHTPDRVRCDAFHEGVSLENKTPRRMRCDRTAELQMGDAGGGIIQRILPVGWSVAALDNGRNSRHLCPEHTRLFFFED